MYINGHNAWMNPYGYLSGELYANMPFFLAMVVLNAVALLVWLVLLCFHRENVLPVQGHIAGVIVLSLLEVMLWYFEYRTFNDQGTRPMVLLTAAIMVGTIKKTLSEPKIRLVLIKKRRNGKDDTVERKRKRVKLSGRVLTPSEDALKSIFLAEGKPLVAWSMAAIPPVPMTEKENLA